MNFCQILCGRNLQIQSASNANPCIPVTPSRHGARHDDYKVLPRKFLDAEDTDEVNHNVM